LDNISAKEVRKLEPKRELFCHKAVVLYSIDEAFVEEKWLQANYL
jgi:hypothetical protein